MVKQWLHGFWLFYMYLSWSSANNEKINESCNYYLTSPKGIISTPNFPDSFTIPIKCRWVIDTSNIPITNASVIVYLTQLYTDKGLKFIEYAYYESETTNFGETIVQEITEANIFNNRSLRSYRPFLVIEFQLDRLEGTHLRVLDNFLNVYGFNITYEVTDFEPNSESCTIQDCSFTGNCILQSDYRSFTCECFEGFEGRHCSNGPLCIKNSSNSICKNGGTCSHVGAAAVNCHCLPGYSGYDCEIPIINPTVDNCKNDICILQCPVSSMKDNYPPCQCKKLFSNTFNNKRGRFECRVKLSNTTSIRNNTETILRKQLGKYLRNADISLIEDLRVLNVTDFAEVIFHFFGASNEEDKIRDTLNRLVQRRRFNDFHLESSYFSFRQIPSLRLQNLQVNYFNEREIRLGDKFSISCSAQGDSSINFAWYKDDMLVNMSKTSRDIWYKMLPNDGSDTYTSILTIEKATIIDKGLFTCQVIDSGLQQCSSVYIDVKSNPKVKVVPMSATLEKGDGIQLMCTTYNMRNLGIGFGWTKNRVLLKLEPNQQVWEDLYPAGSILKITNIQKSAIYTCNIAHESMSVRIEVINRTIIPICKGENTWGLQWPDTGPGSEAFLDCPSNFIGPKVTRLCSMKNATTPVWSIPDFSECLYQPFTLAYTNFKSLTLGYQNLTNSNVLTSLWEVLRSRKLPLYPGEGDRILSILIEIERYQHEIKQINILYNSIEILIQIINHILNDENSILLIEKQILLQQLMLRNLGYWGENSPNSNKHLALSSIVVDFHSLEQKKEDINHFYLNIPSDDYMYPYWHNDFISIQLLSINSNVKLNKSLNGIVIVYKNLTQFLPSVYVKELEDGTDLEYRFNSRIVTVAIYPPNELINYKIKIKLKLRHLLNISRLWNNITCGIENSFGVWDLDACTVTTLMPDESSTYCTCYSPGTFAIFLTSKANKIILTAHEQLSLIIISGCGICLLECLITSIILGIYLWKNRTWLNFLKLQFSIAIMCAMGIFILSIHYNLSESSYSTIAVSLEAFLLVGMAAPISQTLIIYADITQIRPSQQFQPTIIAIITGLPILCVLITELTHKSTEYRHESWWLIFGSGVYNIFLSTVAVMLSLFVILYTGVLKKSHALIQSNIIKKEMIEKRINMMHQAAVIICNLIMVEAASIFYINSSSTLNHYLFAVFSSFLGFVVLFGYIGRKEIMLAAPILRKFYWKKLDKNSNSDPDKVWSKKSSDFTNENTSASTPALLILSKQMEPDNIDLHEYINDSPSAFKKQPISQIHHHYPPEIRFDYKINDNVNLENYNTSPRKYHDNNTLNKYTRSSLHKQDYYSLGSCDSKLNKLEIQIQTTLTSSAIPISIPIPPTAEISSAKVLCSADIESKIGAMPDVTQTSAAAAAAVVIVTTTVTATTTTTSSSSSSSVAKTNVTLTDCPKDFDNDIKNISKVIFNQEQTTKPELIANTDDDKINPEITITDCENPTNVMLDRISHDLDYLLNRHNLPSKQV